LFANALAILVLTADDRIADVIGNLLWNRAGAFAMPSRRGLLLPI
jgi:hypothetical protein